MQSIFRLRCIFTDMSTRKTFYSTLIKKKAFPKFEKAFYRGAEWARTTDSRIFSPMLYQLSYSTLNWGAQK